MNVPIKVLQIHPKYSIRTSDLQEEIISALSNDDFDVTAAYLTGSYKEGGMRSASKKTKYFNLPKKSMKGLRLSAIFQLWKYCKEQQFDVIITHRFKPLYILLIVNKLLKKSCRCISVIHANGEFERSYRRRITRFLVDKYWTFVGVSESVKEDLLNFKNAGFTQDNVIYINNSLDIDKISAGLLPRSTARTKLGIDSDAFVFGTIGRLVTVKGHLYLLEAFKQVHLTHPSAKLVIIGGGELESQLKEYIHKNELKTAVILTGNIFDAYQYLNTFDVFVLSSLSEGLPLVLLEAMMAKLPVIATKVGAVEHVIANNGMLIAPKSTEALSSAMLEYIQLTPQQRQTLGENLRKRVTNNFSIESFHNNYRNLVKGLK